MDKPQKKTKSFYDYLKCSEYLEKKYNYKEHDYAGKYKWEGNKIVEYNENVPHLNFWHYVCDHYNISNGCFITFSKEFLDDNNSNMPEFVKKIYNYYLDEFADENGEIEFLVSW